MKETYYILTINKTDLAVMVSTMTDKEKAMFPQVLESVRWNNTETKCIVSLKPEFEGKPPQQIAHLTAKYKEEMEVEIKNNEWQ